jgi:hypothetical protein
VLCGPLKRRATILPEYVRFKCQWIIPIVLGPILDFIEEQEVMIVIDMLVLKLTTPEEMNGWKHEVTV